MSEKDVRFQQYFTVTGRALNAKCEENSHEEQRKLFIGLPQTGVMRQCCKESEKLQDWFLCGLQASENHLGGL